MAKMQDTKMTVSLDSEAKRLLRNLTKSLDKLATAQGRVNWTNNNPTRLTEPALDVRTPDGRPVEDAIKDVLDTAFPPSETRKILGIDDAPLDGTNAAYVEPPKECHQDCDPCYEDSHSPCHCV